MPDQPAKFDAKAFWATRLYKSWVIHLTATVGRGRHKSRTHHVMYVRAKDSAGAIRTAKENTFLKGRLSGSCRLATPEDLGCVATPARRAA